MKGLPSRRVAAIVSVLLTVLVLVGLPAAAPPEVEEKPGSIVVAGRNYRVAFEREAVGLRIELRDSAGAWRLVAKPGAVALGLAGKGSTPAGSGRATLAWERRGDAVAVGQETLFDPLAGSVLDLHFLCTDRGILAGARISPPEVASAAEGSLWLPPRIALDPASWDGYLYWSPEGAHAGKIAALDPPPAYAGVSPWGSAGDTAAALDPARPALILESESLGTTLGVVHLDPAAGRAGRPSFLQRHTPSALYLYGGIAPAREAGAGLWAWLAPFPQGSSEEKAALVEVLVREGKEMAKRFRPLAPPLPDTLRRSLPDFPASLRRPRPVEDILDAVVYTVNESTDSDAAVGIAAKVGSDVIIRGWFKWAQAPDVARRSGIPGKVHALGALFGGGITCSALYDGENGITREALLDMATRGPAGQLVDAWGVPGVRHGSLSSPAYLDYLFRWCREQIDAAADYLFMDEHTAALSGLEGYDDHSLADFRRYLLSDCPRTRGWTPGDRRWKEELVVDIGDARICPTGGMESFDYRAFLRAKGLLEKPLSPENPLRGLWEDFRAFRDDRSWRALTGRIRSYADEKGRRVLLSANGLARYVDLQVLGVWGAWSARDGRIELRDDQIPSWRSIVARGQEIAGKRVPVVLFHDWGMGDPPFPWLAVPPSDREIWMRVRGAEIYAAEGFFAFPVLGPFGCDASRDGTLAEIARQTAFYQSNRDLYLRARYLCSEAIEGRPAGTSAAAWWREDPPAVFLHAINREMRGGRLVPRRDLKFRLPLDRPPDSVAIVSPDREGERQGAAAAADGCVEVTIPDLEAYAVAILRYDRAPDLGRLADPPRLRLAASWSRPARAEFRVGPGGVVEDGGELNGYLQGMLHQHLRNPPTFLVRASAGTRLRILVRAVAATGARIEWRVDGKAAAAVDLPDRDGLNDGGAAEYDRVLEFEIPQGEHRLTLDNVGPDWAALAWIEFRGEFERPGR